MGGLLALVGVAAIVIGVISVFKPIQRLGIRSRKAAALVLVGGFVLSSLGGALLPESEPTEAPTRHTTGTEQVQASGPEHAPQPTSKPEPEPEPELEPEPEPSQQELTAEVVRQLAGLKDITDVQILGLEGERIVWVYYPLGSIWDEDHGVRRAAEKALDVFEGLFTHAEVVEVVTFAQGKFYDQYGNEKVDNAVRIAWSRETAEQINWTNFRRMVASEPERVYKLAEFYAFHAGFYNGIQNKRGLSVSWSKD